MPAATLPSDATTVARLATDEPTARRVIDLVAESIDAFDTVAGASEDAPGRWTVAIHFREPPNETAMRALVALAAGPDAANALVFETTAPQDWVKASLAGLTPVRAGRFVVHGAHDRGRVPVNRIAIEIAASLAFGTGHHATTRGCLIALDRIVKQHARRSPANRRPIPQRPLPRLRESDREGARVRSRPRMVLDLGTGTGVLAIAAARALHRRVVASDIDPIAVKVARDNARLNRASRYIEIVRAAGLDAQRLRGRYELVLANILLAPLQRLAPPIARNLAPNARVVLSGLLRAQSSAALATYRAHGLALERSIPLEGWVTLVLRKCPDSEVRKHSRHTLMRTSESKGHLQLYGSSAPFEPEVRNRTRGTGVRTSGSGH